MRRDRARADGNSATDSERQQVRLTAKPRTPRTGRRRTRLDASIDLAFSPMQKDWTHRPARSCVKTEALPDLPVTATKLSELTCGEELRLGSPTAPPARPEKTLQNRSQELTDSHLFVAPKERSNVELCCLPLLWPAVGPENDGRDGELTEANKVSIRLARSTLLWPLSISRRERTSRGDEADPVPLSVLLLLAALSPSNVLLFQIPMSPAFRLSVNTTTTKVSILTRHKLANEMHASLC